MKSHITNDSGTDKPYTHVANTVYMHLLKWGSPHGQFKVSTSLIIVTDKK